MNFLFDIIKGIIIGIANIVPGVSGGTMMISMGVYEKTIGVVNNLFKDIKKSIITLFPLGVGILIGIVAFSFIIPWSLEAYPFQTSFCFVGLILGGIPSIIDITKKNIQKEGKSISASHIISFVALFALVVGMATLNETQTTSVSFELNVGFMITMFIIGVIAAATIVIPGVSGSLVLMILGYYEGIMSSISGFIAAVFTWNWDLIWYYVGVLAPFGIGVIAGVFAVARLIEFLFKRFAAVTYSGILGLVIASPIGVILKLAHNEVDVVTIIISIVLLAAGTWFTYWFAKKTEVTE